MAQNWCCAKSAIRHSSSSLSFGSSAFSVFLQHIFTCFTRPIIKVSADEKDQVRSNKDASEGRDEDRIAEPDFMPVACCRLFAGILQIFCRLFDI